MTMKIEIRPEHHKIIKEKFNVVAEIDARDFDRDYSILESLLLKHKRESYTIYDKFLISAMDINYYDDLLPCSILVINMIRIFERLNIPFFTLLFITTHNGMEKEFDIVLKDHPKDDRPVVLYTMISNLNTPPTYDWIEYIETDNIERAGMCLMHMAKSHRVALYNYLIENNLDKQIAISQHFSNNYKQDIMDNYNELST